MNDSVKPFDYRNDATHTREPNCYKSDYEVGKKVTPIVGDYMSDKYGNRIEKGEVCTIVYTTHNTIRVRDPRGIIHYARYRFQFEPYHEPTSNDNN